MMAGRSDTKKRLCPAEPNSIGIQAPRLGGSRYGGPTSSLLRVGLQDPLDDVMAAQTPDRIVVDGVHAGAEGLLLQLRHPANHQPTSHTQQQQQQQL